MTRKSLGILAAAAWAFACAAQAQIELSWTMANNRTVLMEPIRATVRIVNNTGQNLDLSPRGNAKLFFDVEDQPTSTVPETGQPLVRQPIIIPVGETREVEVNLLDAYRIVKGQSYMLKPVFEFAGMRFLGDRRSLEIQPGIELAKRDYGMPASGDARTVSLRLINRDRNDQLFFRIDNSSSGFCLGVYELGRVIRFFTPCLEQDREGAFHVLHQTSPDRFVHSVFGYDGAPQGGAYYAAQAGNIHLVRNESGGVEVQGGTPYVEDPENPGQLVAPALPPSHPYSMTLGELPAKGNAAERDQKAIAKDKAQKAVAQEKAQKAAAREKAGQTAAQEKARAEAAREKSHAGSEPVSW